MVVHAGDDLGEAIPQGEALTGVVQAAGETVEHGHARIADGEGDGIRVGTQDEPPARCQRGAGREGVSDAFKKHPTQIERRGPEVLQFDEFIEAPADWVVHDLGETQRDAERGNFKGGLGHGAPVGPVQSARPHHRRLP